jgi:hypothetical protein
VYHGPAKGTGKDGSQAVSIAVRGLTPARFAAAGSDELRVVVALMFWWAQTAVEPATHYVRGVRI